MLQLPNIGHAAWPMHFNCTQSVPLITFGTQDNFVLRNEYGILPENIILIFIMVSGYSLGLILIWISIGFFFQKIEKISGREIAKLYG